MCRDRVAAERHASFFGCVCDPRSAGGRHGFCRSHSTVRNQHEDTANHHLDLQRHILHLHSQGFGGCFEPPTLSHRKWQSNNIVVEDGEHQHVLSRYLELFVTHQLREHRGTDALRNGCMHGSERIEGTTCCFARVCSWKELACWRSVSSSGLCCRFLAHFVCWISGSFLTGFRF